MIDTNHYNNPNIPNNNHKNNDDEKHHTNTALRAASDSFLSKKMNDGVLDTMFADEEGHQNIGSPTSSQSKKYKFSIDSSMFTRNGRESENDEDEQVNVPEEEEDNFIEFTDKIGRTLLFDPQTLRIKMNDGNETVGVRKWSMSLGIDEDAAMNDKDMQELKRNANIVHAAWGKQQDESKIDEEDDGSDKLTLEKVVQRIQMIDREVEAIVNSCQQLTPPIIEHMRSTRKSLSQAQKTIEQLRASTQDCRNYIDALTDFEKLSWNFAASPTADYYRAAAIAFDHDSYAYHEWHMPQFFSSAPLGPANSSDGCLCFIKLPTFESTGDKRTENTGGRNDISSPVPYFKAKISSNDTPRIIISSIMKKSRMTGDPDDYVLKAVGFSDFMVGDVSIMTYEYVRSCLRDGKDINLMLVPRPSPLPPLQSLHNLPQLYEKKVNPNVRALTETDYKTLSTQNLEWYSLKHLPMRELFQPFQLTIVGADYCNAGSIARMPLISELRVRCFILHGASILSQSDESTGYTTSCVQPRWWHRKVFSNMPICSIPRAARICFMLIGRSNEKESVLAYSVRQLVNESGQLISGRCAFRMWSIGKERKGQKMRDMGQDFFIYATNVCNYADKHCVVLHIAFDEYELPVVAPLVEVPRQPNVDKIGPEIHLKSLTRVQQKRFEALLNADVLYKMTSEDKALLWHLRHSCTKFPHMLSKFLQSVHWESLDYRFEAYRLLKKWAPPGPSEALELLNVKFSDYTVRKYAVDLLQLLADDELRMFLLQLVQCLKFEPYHDSPLVRLLIRRSLKAPLSIGHFLFWHLKAELHEPEWCERYYLVIEEMLSHNQRLAFELRKQNDVVIRLLRSNDLIIRLKRQLNYPAAQVTQEYYNELQTINVLLQSMGQFRMPINPRLEASTLQIKKCKYMSSKMMPLWLVFNNADTLGSPIYMIFKSGDDLRQDILTLQLLQIMDRLWLGAGLDMRLTPYRCIAVGINASGDGMGFIEVVTHSETTSGIHLEHGGGAIGALKDVTIDLYLRKNNEGDQYNRAVENFVHSCAGYCVATFVLGVGDRHNGNIMVTFDGHLFHIDFGHFLGNFKKKFGVNRERAAFVLTPEMGYAMGGKNYQKSSNFAKFRQLATMGFNVLRKNHRLLEMLFMLMLPAGMPELSRESDILYMREKMQLDMTEKKADKMLDQEIDRSLGTLYRRFDNLIHNLKHGS